MTSAENVKPGCPQEPEGFFPVMAWDRPPADPAVLDEMRACGLTMAGFMPPAGLDACRRCGLKAIVQDPRTHEHDWKTLDEKTARRDAQSLVREVGGHPSVFGYYLRDEPSADLFPGLAAMSSALRELAPDHWAYVNLFPNYASSEQLGAPTYEEYLERFIAVCRPKILSYDNYFLMLDEPRKQAFYWRNLRQMRAASRRHDIPFWNIVLSVAHFHYRQATDADLRLQMYSTLAYGGRGLSYYTYCARLRGNYRLAPLDPFGHKTRTWDALRSVNLQLRALAPTMLRLSSTDVYHLGAVPEGCQGPSAAAIVSSQNDASLLIGEFRHADGSAYAMAVNTDLHRSTPLELKFRDNPSDVQILSSYNGQPNPFRGEQKWLAPGQGMLLRLG